MRKTTKKLDKREQRLRQGARLRQARKEAGFRGPKAVADKYPDINVNTYKAHEDGRNGFGPVDARRYAEIFGVSAAWLMLEEGEPRSELTYVPLDEDATGVAAGTPYRPQTAGASPGVDARTGAGSGQLGQEVQVDGWSGHRVVDEWVFPRSFHREMRTQAGLVWVMPVIGNSMEPTLIADDRVLVDTTHTNLNPDAIYVIDYGTGPQVKQVMIIPGSRPRKIRIISINPTYPPDIRPLEEVRIIGRVCGRVSRM